ncbi:MAG: DUF58 domain-containing protein [Planctomycetes bacterium]|nr:DUF58 domain-containing protein [Planctomycetota bacterium]
MKWPRSRLVRGLWRVWRDRLTLPGKLWLAAVFLAGVSASPSLTLPIYHLFLPLATLYACAYLCGFGLRPRSVRITGELPRRATAGETARADLVVENRSRHGLYEVGLGLFGLPAGVEQVDRHETLARLGAGESASLPVRLRARRRGIYPLPELSPYSSFPFQLFRHHGPARPSSSLIVLPAFHPLAAVEVPVGRLHQPGGIALTSNVGESPEYVGNREYVPGDPVRRLDFRSWARLARPVVREYQEEYYCRLALVLDTRIRPGRRKRVEGFPELEAAISLSASVADVLARGDYLIDLFAAGPELYVFRGGRSVAHFENILEILAGIEECRTDPFETIVPALADEFGRITALICVFLDWDDARERLVRQAVESGTRAKVLIVRDGPTTIPFASAIDWAGPVTALTPDSLRKGRWESV